MCFDPEEILEKYARSDWYSRLCIYCHHRDLRSEFAEIEKNQIEDTLLEERIIAGIDK